MYLSRRLTFALTAIVALVAATPAFAQNSIGSLPSVTFSTPAPAPKMQEKEQGLGIFLQGGFVRGTTYSSTCPVSCDNKLNPTGFIVGVGFGGNKSGAFGIGADINYELKSTDNVTLIGTTFAAGTLKTQVIQIPIYGRVNFMGHATKSAPTLYVIFGGYIDILLKGDIDGIDVKDDFNGFDIGPMGGIGFEVARVGIEGRGMWAMKTLQSTGNGTFVNGMTESKVFTFVLLFKVRLN
jgi:hypothetical protein